jgi:GABA(A) receptor-associated protein
MKFKDKHTFMERKEQSTTIMQKYPTRVPVICERLNNSLPEIDRKKYLVPDDLTMNNFLFVIRKRLKLKSEMAMYLFVNNKIMAPMTLMTQIYDENADSDGFLYITYAGENTFG